MHYHLSEALPDDENEWIYTHGDTIAYQFYYGDYEFALGILIDNKLLPREFLAYLCSQAEENEMSLHKLYNGHFSASFWLDLGVDYLNEQYRRDNYLRTLHQKGC